jgi:hypothetical protein
MQRRAAGHDGRFVTVGPLVLFSTDTGDAWLLDPADQLAARLAHDADPEDIHFEESDEHFAIGWKATTGARCKEAHEYRCNSKAQGSAGQKTMIGQKSSSPGVALSGIDGVGFVSP